MILDEPTLRARLHKANAILAAIAQKESHITPVTAADQPLFQSFFDREERSTYGNSWLYVIQGAFGIGPHDLGYKYYDGENLCMITIHPKIERPDILMMYWVRPLGPRILDIIADYADRIQKKHGISCYVKKLFPDQYDYLRSKGFKSSTEFPWHSACHAEDDTFPEVVYDRQETLKLLNTASKQSTLGRLLKECSKLESINKIEITDFNSKTATDAYSIARQCFVYHEHKNKKLNISSVFDYYNVIFQPGDNAEKKLVLINQRPVGFYVLEIKRKWNMANIYACLTYRPLYKYLTDYILIYLFSMTGTPYFNTGGSEDESLNDFKEKYSPSQKIIMSWLTNYPLQGSKNSHTNSCIALAH